MRVNADFSQPVAITPDRYQWVGSPEPGVERVMLDRIGGEQARATSLVRYAPGSRFTPHIHTGGEEILVLSGTFSDDTGDYPADWYLRNPPGSAHEPSSGPGALIFVKLRQMAPGEREPVRINTHDPAYWTTQGRRQVCALVQSDLEKVVIERIATGQRLFDAPVTGVEILVLSGELRRHDKRYVPGTWIRLPVGAYPEFTGGGEGTTLYVKTGALGGGHPPQASAAR